MRNYALRLGKYGIDQFLFNELRFRCRRYPSWLAELSAIRGGFNSHEITGMPRGSDTSDPTAKRAIRAMQLQQDIEEVEQAAIAVDVSLYQCILDNVTRGVRYEDMDVPCGRRQFYEARQKYFWHLAQIREMGNYGAILS